MAFTSGRNPTLRVGKSVRAKDRGHAQYGRPHLCQQQAARAPPRTGFVGGHIEIDFADARAAAAIQ